jgi:nucleotide-binding universal stress UspA family protein
VPENRIVVGYDGSVAAIRAARWALDEAVRLGAPVEFCCAAGTTAPAPRHRIEDMLTDAALDAAATHPAVDVRTSIATGSAADVLGRRSSTAARLVLGGRSGPRCGGPLGTVSAGVTRRAACPVVVIRGPIEDLAPVLVGVDGSGTAALALDFAFDQAATLGVPLRAVRAVLPSLAVHAPGPGLDAVVESEWRTLAELVEHARAAYPTVEATYEVIVGHPATVLLAAAGTARLVVVGTRGEQAFRGTQLGSVSRHLLRHAETSVAVIRDAAARPVLTGTPGVRP